MNKKEYKILADEICEKTGFVAEEIIYTGSYYKRENIRNVIFSGEYKNKSAVLKIIY
ncbi:MAG: hypothetical protein U9N04_04165 [Patescibacteria group bacterium]|nr:hypothetical protein [Patescibacteria group bacterium]